MYQDKIKIIIKNALLEAGFEELKDFVIEKPKDKRFGDYSTNVALIAAKKYGKNPHEIAETISQKIISKEFRIKIAGVGFINFYFNNEIYFEVVKNILALGSQYGSSKIGEDRKVLVEYSEPNVNKYLHIGHARNDFLGMALANILQFSGYKVIKANYYNDRGIAIAKTMLMYDKYHQGEDPVTLGIKPDVFVGKIYAEYEKELENHPELKQEAADYLIRYEAEDPQIIKLWKKITNWAYMGFNQTYKREGSHFDVIFHESEIYKKGKAVVQKYLEKGIFQKAQDGHIFIDLTNYGLDEKVLMRSDGTAIYITSDLVLAEEKEKMGIDKSIYVVDIYQSYHFKVLFKIFELLGYKWASKCFHLGYGYVFLGDKKMSSRKGNTIATDELLDDLKKKIRIMMTSAQKQKVTNDKEREDVAESLALGAAKYTMLKYEEQKDIRFIPDETIKLEGDTGPYLQYTYARIKGILKKSLIGNLDDLNTETKINTSENELITHLVKFPEVIKKVSMSYKPHFLCNYLFNLAQLFNSFYNVSPVLKSENETKKFRLALCMASAQVLKNGLDLLNIDTPERL